MDQRDAGDMPLEPRPGYIVAEVIEVLFYHPVTLPDGTETALKGAGGRGTPIMRVVAVGEDAEDWQVGDYFANHPQNSDLTWNWKDFLLPFQVIKAKNICAKLNSEAIEKELELMKKFEKVQPPMPSQLPAGVVGPPEKKIILPEDADLPPQL